MMQVIMEGIFHDAGGNRQAYFMMQVIMEGIFHDAGDNGGHLS
jgi:hypothetical protein